jgi:hypothetical protein
VDGLELWTLRRQNQLLMRRLDLIEQVLEASGLLESLLGGGVIPGVGWPGDPGPDDLGRLGGLGSALLRRVRPGPIPDPAVLDLTRLNRVQLESALHTLAAERTRLDGLEAMIKERLGAGGAGARS